jgi:DNA polymerase-3 subunit delta'
MNFVMPVTSAKSKEALSQNFLADWRAFLLENPYQTLNDWMQYIGAENKQGNISKEESRQLIRFASLKAFEAEFKVILVWLPELMHATASNALLKLLEEPPAKTIFLLVAHASDKLLATILSRTQKVNVRAFSEEEVVGYLQEQLQVAAPAAYQIANLAEGSLQAARKLSREMTSDYFAFFVQWMRHCFSYKFGEIVGMSEDFQKLGRENQKALLQYSLNSLRRVMLFGVDQQLVPFIPPAELDFVRNFSKLIHPANVSPLSEELNKAHYHIERNANPKIVFVDSSLRIAQYLKS